MMKKVLNGKLRAAILTVCLCVCLPGLTACSQSAQISGGTSGSAAGGSGSTSAAVSASSAVSSSFAGTPKAKSVWSDSLTKYREDDAVRHLIFVQWIRDSSEAMIQVYEKDPSWNNAWTITLSCSGYVGRNGCRADKKEGDSSTPIGDFGVLTAFGIRQNPGTALDWLDVTDDLWCPDSAVPDYNKIVSSRNGGTASGEHLIEYSPQYNYAMFLDYNTACNPEDGSAIFFHCIGPKQYTGGCVAVSEENMKYILSVFGRNDRVIIDSYYE